MLSLTGLPPLLGFWGKFILILRALAVPVPDTGPNLHIWFIILTVATVLNAAISAAYYLRLVGAMYFRQPADEAAPCRAAGGSALAAGLCAMLVLAMGVYPAPLMRLSETAAQSAVTPPAPPIDSQMATSK
jgi:NADH-quinone oxidoreductase subunit N